MYAVDNVIEILDEHPQKFFMMVKFGKRFDFTTISEKLLLARRWSMDMHRDSDYEEGVKEMLGTEWESYTNPITQLFYSIGLHEALSTEWNKFNEGFTDNLKPLVLELLNVKISEYIESAGLTALKEYVKIFENKNNKKSFVVKYSIASPFDPSNSLLSINMNWDNNKYSVDVYFVNSSIPTTAELTEDSTKKVKKFMYDITSGEEKVDVEQVPGILNLLEFKDSVELNSYIDLVIESRK